MDPRVGLDWMLGQPQERRYGRAEPGRFAVPQRTPRPLRQVSLPEKFAVQYYELPTVGVWPARPPWRLVGQRLVATEDEALREFDAVCADLRVCNARGPEPRGGIFRAFGAATPRRCMWRSSIPFGVQGNRAIVRVFASRDNFRTSRVVRECDVPDWTAFR